MAQSIFISYSSKDKPFAKNLVHNLEAYGLDTWFDSDDIRAGVKWSSAIQNGLNQSAVIIVIISPDSMASKNVEDEWQYFLDKKKPIIPILHRPSDNIHFQLMRIQYIDFVNLAFEDALEKLLFELRLNHIIVADSPSLSPPAPQVVVKTAPKAAKLSSQSLTIIFLALLIPIIGLSVYFYWPKPTPNDSTASPSPDSIATETSASSELSPEPTEILASPRAEATEIPSAGLMLDVPYVSQHGRDAPFNNDDGPAAMLMVLRWYAQSYPDSSTARRIANIDVRDVSLAAGMDADSDSVSLTMLFSAARTYALPIEHCTGISLERIFEEIDNGRPIMMLVDYLRVRPDVGYNGGHFVVVIGYNTTQISSYDSYNEPRTPELEKLISLDYAEFEAVISRVPTLSQTRQGFIFGEGNTCAGSN